MLTLASSKPSISVSKVDRSLSPTVMLLLELPPLPFKNNNNNNNNNNHIEEEKKNYKFINRVWIPS